VGAGGNAAQHNGANGHGEAAIIAANGIHDPIFSCCGFVIGIDVVFGRDPIAANKAVAICRDGKALGWR